MVIGCADLGNHPPLPDFLIQLTVHGCISNHPWTRPIPLCDTFTARRGYKSTMKKSVYWIVQTEAQAERIVDQLQTAGFSSNDVSALFPDKSTTKDFAHEKETKAPEGATAGERLVLG